MKLLLIPLAFLLIAATAPTPFAAPHLAPEAQVPPEDCVWNDLGCGTMNAACALVQSPQCTIQPNCAAPRWNDFNGDLCGCCW